jgi:hypothetical protein
MTREEKRRFLDLVEEIMTKETRETLLTMCMASVKAFESVSIKDPIVGRIPKIQALMGLMAIESASKHHALLSAKGTQHIEITAHKCAEAMTRTMLDEYDEELSLDQNLQLWKLKKA